MANKGWVKESNRHSQSAKGIKTGRKSQAQSNMKFKDDELMFPKENIKPKLNSNVDFLNKKVLTEREVLLAKRRLNAGKLTNEKIFGEEFESKQLTPEQNEKGKTWLENKWKSPKGVERKNNPFGSREIEVLENFDHIELSEFTDRANFNQSQAGIKNYQPLYDVFDKEGNAFQYLVEQGEISIVG